MSTTSDLYGELAQTFNELASGGDEGLLSRRTLFDRTSQIFSSLAEANSAIIAPSVGPTTFAALDDVTVFDPFEGEVAMYVDGRWRNRELTAYSKVGHNHDARYYLKDMVDDLLATKSDVGHNHDDRYFGTDQSLALFASKSNIGHTHDFRYYPKTEADTRLQNALAPYSRTGHTHWFSSLMGVPDFNVMLAPYSRIGHVHDYGSLMNLPVGGGGGGLTLQDVRNELVGYQRRGQTIDYNQLQNLPTVTGIGLTELRSALAPYSRIGHTHFYEGLMGIPDLRTLPYSRIGHQHDYNTLHNLPTLLVLQDVRTELTGYSKLGHNHSIEEEEREWQYLLAGQIFGG